MLYFRLLAGFGRLCFQGHIFLMSVAPLTCLPMLNYHLHHFDLDMIRLPLVTTIHLLGCLMVMAMTADQLVQGKALLHCHMVQIDVVEWILNKIATVMVLIEPRMAHHLKDHILLEHGIPRLVTFSFSCGSHLWTVLLKNQTCIFQAVNSGNPARFSEKGPGSSGMVASSNERWAQFLCFKIHAPTLLNAFILNGLCELMSITPYWVEISFFLGWWWVTGCAKYRHLMG